MRKRRSSAAAPGHRGRSRTGALAPPDSALQDGQREAAAGHGRLRQPDALADLALLQQAIAQPNPMQYVVDATLKQHPDGTNAAIMRRRAPRFFDRVRGAVDLEGRMLGGRDHVVNADLVGWARQRVASVRATRAPNDSAAPQLEHDLLDVVARQPFAGRDLAPGDWPIVDATGQMKRTDEAVFGLSRDAHAFTLLAARRSGQPPPPASMPCFPPGTPISVIFRRSRTSSIW